MDSVPFRFHKAVASTLAWYDLHPFAKLSAIGVVAKEALEKDADRSFRITNGDLVDEYFWYKSEDGEIVRVEDGRRCRSVLIHIDADGEPYKADIQVLQRIQSYCQGKEVRLGLYTHNLDQEMAAFLDKISVKNLTLRSDFLSNVQSTLKMMPILKNIMRKKTLDGIRLDVGRHTDITFGNLLLDLLKQEQFGFATFSHLNSTFFKALFLAWHENSAQMAGKILQFKGSVKNVDRDQWGFEEATRDDLDYLFKFHPRAAGFFSELRRTRTLHTRSEGGGRMFWMVRLNVSGLVLVFL